jgi:hypothetical protein
MAKTSARRRVANIIRFIKTPFRLRHADKTAEELASRQM